ncbi:MAG: alpha/beta hydrolase [Syntrophobacteraceae bacterium]|nr:alpha/beta hydrolase [Syntrophobacteraceae bacterium]
MPFCSRGEVRIYFEAHGEGAPLMLISGLSGGVSSWYGQVPFFAERYRTITFDNRGAGRSDMPPGPYAMRQFAEDALCVLDHLGIERALVMGLSMGGMIAQELALLAPSRIMALALGCTHHGGEHRVGPSREVMAVLVNNDGLTQDQIVEKNLPIFLSRRFLTEEPHEVELYRRAQLSTELQPESAFHAQLAAIVGFDSRERLGSLTAPTLIITGTEDLLVPKENAHLLAAAMPGAELVEIPGAAHALHAECRDLLNELVHRFFQRILRETTQGASGQNPV